MASDLIGHVGGEGFFLVIEVEAADDPEQTAFDAAFWQGYAERFAKIEAGFRDEVSPANGLTVYDPRELRPVALDRARYGPEGRDGRLVWLRLDVAR